MNPSLPQLGDRKLLTKEDLAKYPFLPEAADYVKELLLDINELTKPEYKRLLEHAEARVANCIMGKPRDIIPRDIPEIEIPAFPVAIMLVTAVDDPLLKKRYALQEAKKMSQQLREEEKTEKIARIAEFFNWKLAPAGNNGTHGSATFKLHFTDYLRNATVFHEKEWKLASRQIQNGEVLITKNDAARLLEEEIRRYVEKKLETEPPTLPEPLQQKVERLQAQLKTRKNMMQLEETPKIVTIDAFPPCIKALYDMAMRGQHLSHIGRFALTTFLVNIGMTPENVVNLFKTSSDFNEKMTRYQVEHIAGSRGSRTRYTPPKCETLNTHGVCPGKDDICRMVRHPLKYYNRKLRNKITPKEKQD